MTDRTRMDDVFEKGAVYRLYEKTYGGPMQADNELKVEQLMHDAADYIEGLQDMVNRCRLPVPRRPLPPRKEAKS